MIKVDDYATLAEDCIGGDFTRVEYRRRWHAGPRQPFGNRIAGLAGRPRDDQLVEGILERTLALEARVRVRPWSLPAPTVVLPTQV